MMLCVNVPASLGGTRCNPVTPCPEPGVWLNFHGFRFRLDLLGSRTLV